MSESFPIVLARRHLGRDFPEIARTTGVALFLLSTVSVIGNGFVLVSILLDPFKNIRRSPVSSLMFSLALADLLVGILAGPLMAYWLIYIDITNSEPFSLNIVAFITAVSMSVSLYSLVALSVDRRIAITTPLQYAYRVTKKKIWRVNVFIWGYFIVIQTLGIVFDYLSSIFDIIFAAHSAIASIILVVLNITAVRYMRTQAFNMKRTVDPENVVVMQNAINREKAVTQTTVIMVAVFLVCFWPFVVISFVVYGMQKVTDIFDIRIMLWMYFTCFVLECANSLMNPFLYAWRLPKYKKTFKYFLIQVRKRLCISGTQHHTNRSPQFSTTECKQNAPDSINMNSLPRNKNAVESSTTKQAAGSSPSASSDVQKHVCRKGGHSTENTWL